MTAGKRRDRSRTKELRRLAAPLEPKVAPYYVDVSITDERHRAPGWYMIPNGLNVPVYLGAGATAAALFLFDMLRSARARA